MNLRKPHWAWSAAPLMLVLVLFLWWRGLLFDGDAVTRLYLLSTVCETVGALFGITLSVSLVAAQIATQIHTSRAVHYLLRDKLFLSVATLNGVTIALGLLLLGNGAYLDVQSSRIAGLDEAVVLILALLCVFSVPLLIIHLLTLLSPEGMARRLAKAITLDTIKRDTPLVMSADGRVMVAFGGSDDVLTPLSDIAASSIRRGHFEGGMAVVWILASQIRGVLKDIGERTFPGEEAEDNGTLVAAHFCLHIRRILSSVSSRDFELWVEQPLGGGILGEVFTQCLRSGLVRAQYELLSLIEDHFKEDRGGYFTVTLVATVGAEAYSVGQKTVADRAAGLLEEAGWLGEAIDYLKTAKHDARQGYLEYLIQRASGC